MKILVTGGSGFIGSHLVDTLLAAGHYVSVLDLRKPIRSGVLWIDRDIREPLDDVIRGFDAVYHLAAVANARVCGQHPRKAYEINVMGTFNVANACRKNGIPRLLYASTTWAAGLQVGEFIEELTPFELHKAKTIYGATKIIGEMTVQALRREGEGSDFTIMRFGVPFGPRMWEGLVVRAFMLQAEKYGKLTIYGDGMQGRNFLYVRDMCDGQVKLLAEVAADQIYNLGSEDFVTIRQLAEEVVKHIPAEITYITQARVEPKVKAVSSKKALEDVGWEPPLGFPDGISKCIEWWRDLDPDLKEDVPYFVP